MMSKRDKITVRHPGGRIQRFDGREAWALRELCKVGALGLTSLERPAPRWSHYIFKLRRAGVAISTTPEPHGGTYSGTHGRYRLVTSVTVVPDEVSA